MKVRRAQKRRQPQRGGFTLIELLVVISIIGVLASLILPGVQNAREAARRTQCMNNMRQVGVAIHTYASANGELPPLVGGIDYFSQVTGTPRAAPAPWPVHLLPFLDQAGLYDRLTATSRQEIALAQLNNTGIESLSCPNDPGVESPGAMSFVVNMGYIGSPFFNDTAPLPATPYVAGTTAPPRHRLDTYDWGFNGQGGAWGSATRGIEDAKATLATGLFFPQNSPQMSALDPSLQYNLTGLKNTLDKVKDGLSQTLMISENLDTPETPTTNNTGWGWLSGHTGDLGFGLKMRAAANGRVTANTQPAGVGVAGTATAPQTNLGMQLASPFQLPSSAANPANDFAASRINEQLNSVRVVGGMPRPRSLHPTIVNAIYADGHAQSVSQGIDAGVYARLLTSSGNAYGQQILSSNDF